MAEEIEGSATGDQTGDDGGQTDEGQTETGQKENYTLNDAVDDAFNDAEKAEESIEKPVKEEEKPTEKKPEEAKKEEIKTEIEYPEDVKAKIATYDQLLSNKEYQRQVIDELAKAHGLKIVSAAEKEKPKTPVTSEFLNSLDEDVKEGLSQVINAETKELREAVDTLTKYIKQQEVEKEQAAKVKREEEISSFIRENKDLLATRLPDGATVEQTLAGLVRTEFSGVNNKRGMQLLLNALTEEIRTAKAIEEAKAAAVAEALGRSAKVSEKVKRISSVTSPAKVHSGDEGFKDLRAAFDAAEKQHTAII